MLAGDMLIDKRQSVYIGNLGPIPLYLHWSFLFLLLMAWPGGSWQDLSFSVTFLLILLLGILLHEMGHALAAKVQGAMGITITLWALGGLCSSVRDRLPRREIIILIAGPAVSFALAWGSWLGLEYADATAAAFTSREALADSWVSNPMIRTALFLGYWVNLQIGIFNMLPIFPLDGGQIVFNACTMMTRESIARQLSLAIAVVGALAYIAWDSWMSGGQMNLGAWIMMGYLLFNAFTYLR